MKFATTFNGIAIGTHDTYDAAAAHIADAVSEAPPGTPEADDSNYSVVSANDVEPDYSDPAACLEAARADVDGVPTVEVRSAYRDLTCSMNGTEVFRRVAYAPAAGDVATEWPDADRLPGRGIRSADRHCSVDCEVPVGTLVQTFSRDVYRGSKGKCSVRFGIVYRRADGAGRIFRLAHRTLRKRPVYEVTLPTGELAYVARRV